MDIHETLMTKRVAQTLDSVADTGGIALITAPLGSGKTTAVAFAARDRRQVRTVTLVEGLSSARALYRHIALSIGVPAPNQSGAPDLITAVADEVRRQRYTLVLDQCQRLKRPSAFDQVASLADMTGTLVLVGPPALRARVIEHEECASHCTVPLALAEGVTLAELGDALEADFARSWVGVVHEATGGCWRGVRTCVAAAIRASRRGNISTRMMGDDDARKLVGSVLLASRPLTAPKLATGGKPQASSEQVTERLTGHVDRAALAATG